MLKAFFCGDIVNFTNNSEFIDNQLKYIIRECDFSIGNFEAPIKTEQMIPIKKAGPHVFQAKETIQYLKNAGFTIVSLANNHIYDYGERGLKSTIEELGRNNIQFVGAGMNFEEAYTPRIIEKNGIKIGIIAACENEFGCLYEKQNRGGYAWILHRIIEDIIRDLKKQVDYIVLIIHAGVEDIQIPIKEWRELYRRFCEIGVDVIIGHHPHVPQGYEQYHDSFIFYSLGNFYFDTPDFIRSSNDSYSVVLEFYKPKNLKFDIVYHKTIDGKTRMVDKKEVSFDLNILNSLLEKDYEERNNSICLQLFQRYYYSYYKTATKFSFLQLVRRLLFKKSLYSYLLLLHNIKIDSHRFVVQRALTLLTEAP